MNENTIKFWGTLDVASRTMEEIPPNFEELWKAGHYRMRPEDVQRLEAYLKRISIASREIKKTLVLFKGLNVK